VWKGESGKAKGGAVVGRPEAKVDGYSSPQAKKLVPQVSKARLFIGVQKARLGENVVYCVDIAMYDL
jgi:hypothetical protein